MFKNLTNSYEEFIKTNLIDRLNKEEIFVEYARDNRPNKVHIESLSYHVFYKSELHVRKDCQFDLYYDPQKKEYSFSSGSIKTHPESAKTLYDIAQRKLQDPGYYARRLNDLRRKIKNVKTK